MLSCIDLPFINPDWVSLIIWGSPPLRRLENMCELSKVQSSVNELSNVCALSALFMA